MSVNVDLVAELKAQGHHEVVDAFLSNHRPPELFPSVVPHAMACSRCGALVPSQQNQSIELHRLWHRNLALKQWLFEHALAVDVYGMECSSDGSSGAVGGAADGVNN